MPGRHVICVLLLGSSVVWAAGCATESMWQRQVRRSLVSLFLEENERARREIEVALSLASAPPRDESRLAATLQLSAEVEIRDAQWERAAQLLRRAGEFADSSRAAAELRLARLRWVLVQVGDVDGALAVQEELLASLAMPRVVGVSRHSPYVETRTRKLERGRAEAIFAEELIEAGHAEAAEAAFQRAAGLGEDFELIGESNAELALARADALEALGRRKQASRVRAEATAVLAQSDYVREVLLEREYHAIVARWTEDAMPLRIHLRQPRPGQVPDEDAALELVRRSILAWENAAEPGIPRFDFVVAERDADVVVQWVHDRHFRGAIGICESQARWEDEPLSGAQITLVPKIMGRHLTNAQLRHVAIHETGHALGLLGHSAREDDVMYPIVPRSPLATPSERDLRTLRRLYAATPGQAYDD